jgi:alanine-glyoxylate transaminase/serine-glyoxylate transaminase/serine-pyruvate transaminase
MKGALKMLELKKKYGQLAPTERILFGPGPNGIDPRVLRAMSTPVLGHLDPEFLEIMDETSELLRYVYQTENELTISISGTGSSGMDSVLQNLLEAGDKAIVATCGAFGDRLVAIAQRCGAEVKVVEAAEWGRPIEYEQVAAAFDEVPDAKLLAMVHVETSTGVLQPLEDMAKLARQKGALFVADCVTSLGTVPVLVDQWGIDAAYSCTQKGLSCPPGLSPITFSKKARETLADRTTDVPSWYLDLTMIERYWGGERFYHHTAPISNAYSLREALLIIAEEGLEARWARHELNASAFLAGVEAMGLEPFAQEGYRAPSLTTIKIPEGVNDAAVRNFLLKDYNIEIGGGLGPVKGQIWRIGFMGYNSNRKNVILGLSSLASALNAQGFKVSAGDALAAADEVYKG